MKVNEEFEWNDFLGYASHNLKSPLVSVKALLFLLERKKGREREKTMDKIDEKLNLLNLRIEEIVQFLSLFGKEDALVEFFDIDKELKRIIGESKDSKQIELKTEELSIVGRKEIILKSLKAIINRAISISRKKSKLELSSSRIVLSYNSKEEFFPQLANDKENWLKMFIAKRNLENQKIKISIKKKIQDQLILEIPKNMIKNK